MGLMNRFKKNDDLGLSDDPFGKDSGLNLPGDDHAGTSDPFAAPPTSNRMPQSGMPPIDFTNPDINASTGSPRPREREVMEQPSYGQPAAGHAQGLLEKDLQIIIAKLDAIKSEMDSLHQRVQKIERIADEDRAAAQKQRTYARW